MIYTKEVLEPIKHYYYPQDCEPDNREKLSAAYDELEKAEPRNARELMSLLYQSSELMSIIIQRHNELSFRVMQNTTDLEARNALEKFIRDVSPYAGARDRGLLRKYYENPLRQLINQDYFKQLNIFVESLFNDNGIAESGLHFEQQRIVNIYRDKINQFRFQFDGSSYLFRDAKGLLANPDPDFRHRVWEARKAALISEKDDLHSMFSELTANRMQWVQISKSKNYFETAYSAGITSSFAYEDFKQILPRIKKHLKPVIADIYRRFQKASGLKQLAPWDNILAPAQNLLKPFSSPEDLISKTIAILCDIRIEYGVLVNKMWNTGLLDLEARPHKAAGQFFFADSKYGTCRVLMNCTGTHENLSMFFHEIGHVLQMTAMMKNPLFTYITIPLDTREISSQLMVYLSSKYWNDFYPDKSILKSAISYQIEDDLLLLYQSLCSAEFQMQLYDNPDLTPAQREECFLSFYKDYYPFFRQADYDEYIRAMWLEDLAVFEYPFYSVFTSLSLFAVWQTYRSFRRAPDETVQRFQNFLSKATEYDVYQLYEELGLKYDFSEANIRKTLDWISKQRK